MSVDLEALARLRAFNARISRSDPDLLNEMPPLVEFAHGAEAPPEDVMVQESIILRRARPVLKIKDDAAELDFADAQDSEIWRARLVVAAEPLDRAIRAVGRIDLTGAAMAWVGTGWLVRPDIVVTNRHVAEAFVEAGPGGLHFSQVDGREVQADIDFRHEFEREDRRVFSIIAPLLVVPKPGPDIAFFRVAQISGDARLAAPIPLASRPGETRSAAVIGYPAFDSRIPDVDLMEQIYGRAYNKKRLAPGGVTFLEAERLYHDCTTLGGNSGSVVMDLDTGEALGLHYSGAFMRTNYAMRSDVVAEALASVETGRPLRWGASQEVAPGMVSGGQNGLVAAEPGARAVTVTVPVTVTVAVGAPTMPMAAGEDDDQFDETEARPEDYADRAGFLPDFLGEGDRRVALPEAQGAVASDALRFEVAGREETELRYEHFSVVMSRSRRLPLFSAVNIDGSRTKSVARVKWRYDPRIPKAAQIKSGPYGNPPKFSRGHMTRRNDPSWGDDFETARRGNRDSMHVTNAAPQMQSFNAPIWLELEDYALENAVQDGMRISVMTGPFLRADDPVFYGVQVPVSFWKVIAFVHDRTGRLTATGYRMTQRANLPEEEFVFGAFRSSHTNVAAQVTIREIEAEARVSFGELRERDPLDQDEGFGRPSAVVLNRPSQIRFV